MHRLLRLVPVVAALMVTACSSDAASDERTPEPEETTVDLDVTLEADLHTGHPAGTEYPPEADGLAAEYTVTNNGDAPVLVATGRGDVPARDIGRPLPDGDEATWIYTAEDDVIALTKELFTVNRPEGTNAGTAWTIPATRVAPGESVTGRAWALMPLVPVVPASDEFELPGSADLNPNATSWRFCVQVAPDTRSDDTPVIDEYLSDRQLLCSDEAELPPGALADR